MWHVDEGQLHAYLDGGADALEPGLRARLEAHVAACETCRARLEETRHVRERAHALLRRTSPANVQAPAFRTLGQNASSDWHAPIWRFRLSRRAARLGWAASLMLAVALGWAARAHYATLAVADVPMPASALALAPADGRIGDAPADPAVATRHSAEDPFLLEITLEESPHGAGTEAISDPPAARPRSAYAAAGPEGCSELHLPVQRDASASPLVVIPSADSVRVAPATTPQGRAQYGQRVNVRLGMEPGTGAVSRSAVMIFDDGAAGCGPLRSGRSAVRLEPGVAAFVTGVRVEGGTPVFRVRATDVVYGGGSVDHGQVPADVRLPRLDVYTFHELFSALPTEAESARGGATAYARLRDWIEANPELAAMDPAAEIVQRVRREAVVLRPSAPR